jgi:alpha-ketoglutarate-dependent sulfate ester dioxygenase
MPFSVRKLTSRVGALIEGVDFAATPDPATVTALRAALNEHKATVAGEVPVGVDGRPSEQLVGDASHYAPAVELVA